MRACFFLLHKIPDQCGDGFKFEQKTIVTIIGINRLIDSLRNIGSDKLLFFQWKKNIGFNSNCQGLRPDSMQCLLHTLSLTAYIMRIHTLAEYIITEGIKTAGQLFALVSLIGGCTIPSVSKGE